MAWDFSTDPAFEEQLAWMRTFVREEIWPIETVYADLTQEQLDRIYAPLQEQVRARGLWAAHLDSELGGQGFGQVKLGLMHEISQPQRDPQRVLCFLGAQHRKILVDRKSVV